ncbi:Hypothetical protein NocV09_01001730 [Nannochloropsis oceanica]
MDHSAGGGGMAGMDDSMPLAMPMAMDLTLKCTCRVGKIFVSAWDIQTCGTYSASLAVIALFCFLRHLLMMHKTKLILRLAEQDADAGMKRTSSMVGGVCCNVKPGSLSSSYGSTTFAESSNDEESQQLTRIKRGTSATNTNAKGETEYRPAQLRHQLSEEAFGRLGNSISLHARLVLTAYFALLSGSSLLVMLLAMSFNVGIILAILVGEGVGHLVFASDFLHNLVDIGSFH